MQSQPMPVWERAPTAPVQAGQTLAVNTMSFLMKQIKFFIQFTRPTQRADAPHRARRLFARARAAAPVAADARHALVTD